MLSATIAHPRRRGNRPAFRLPGRVYLAMRDLIREAPPPQSPDSARWGHFTRAKRLLHAVARQDE
jgi:hypothetical protein